VLKDDDAIQCSNVHRDTFKGYLKPFSKQNEYEVWKYILKITNALIDMYPTDMERD